MNKIPQYQTSWFTDLYAEDLEFESWA